MGMADWWHSVIAKVVPGNFPNLVSDNVEDAINEIASTAAVSASPGFTWGKSGVVKNAYLLNDNVPSDTAGRIVVVTGSIAAAFVSCDLVTSGEIEIQRRVGATFTTIATITMPADRKYTEVFTVPPLVSLGDELAMFVNNTESIKNPVVGLIIKGSLS